MDRRTARLLWQVLLVAVMAPWIWAQPPVWAIVLWFIALGATVAELIVVMRFGQGSPWRSA